MARIAIRCKFGDTDVFLHAVGRDSVLILLFLQIFVLGMRNKPWVVA